VFVTTGRFSSGAREFADGVGMRLRLIDGRELTKLMVRYNVCVQVRETSISSRSTRKSSTLRGGPLPDGPRRRRHRPGRELVVVGAGVVRPTRAV
jgi:hypothetical protein